jgi:elongation factor Tu
LTVTAANVPVLRIALVGATGHGKTTLASEISEVFAATGQAEFIKPTDMYYDPTLRGWPNVQARFISVAMSDRRYIFGVPRTKGALLSKVFQYDIGNEGAILVVSAADGVVPETRQVVKLAHSCGVPSFVIFLSKSETEDADVIAVAELEARSLLEEYGYDPPPAITRAPILTKSGRMTALNTTIHRLIVVCNTTFAAPTPDVEQPFLMPVGDVHRPMQGGVQVLGRVERGQVSVGDQVEIVGLEPETKVVTVSSIEMYRRQLDSVKAGDNPGLVIHSLGDFRVERGHVLAAPGSVKPHTRFTASVAMLSKEEGGRFKPFTTSTAVAFYIRTTDVMGRMTFDAETANPGDLLFVTISLDRPIALEERISFGVRNGGMTLGIGMVSTILE